MNTTGENKIDVLAVLDFNIDADEIAGANPECVAELREARAAVAELVEAASEYTAIRDWVVTKSAPVLREEWEALKANTDRLDAALARIGGAK